VTKAERFKSVTELFGLPIIVSRFVQPLSLYSIADAALVGRHFSTVIMDDLMHPDTPQPTPFYVIKTSNTEYPYLRRAYLSCTEGGKDILKAKRFASQAAAVAYAGEMGITSKVVEIVKVTTALSTPAPEYTVTKAEPYAAGFFYVVKNETSGSFKIRGYGTNFIPADHERVERFTSYVAALAAAQEMRQSHRGYTYGVYRVEPKTSTAPSIEKVVNIASL
jgi:hypothetical protein